MTSGTTGSKPHTPIPDPKSKNSPASETSCLQSPLKLDLNNGSFMTRMRSSCHAQRQQVCCMAGALACLSRYVWLLGQAPSIRRRLHRCKGHHHVRVWPMPHVWLRATLKGPVAGAGHVHRRLSGPGCAGVDLATRKSAIVSSHGFNAKRCEELLTLRFP